MSEQQAERLVRAVERLAEYVSAFYWLIILAVIGAGVVYGFA